MNKKEESNKIAIFDGTEIRRINLDGEWQYSIEDIMQSLTDSRDIKQYIKKLRQRDDEINYNWGTICTPLPLIARDGKRRSVLCANTEGVFRLIQSIPSKKAEPFKRWLARVGKERLDEIEQPGKAIERAKQYYIAKGYSPEWIQTRTASIETRHTFTDKLKNAGIKESSDYAVLTNEMYKSWSDFNSKEYKAYKGLAANDSLRDNMTPLELATTIFNEATTSEILEKTGAEGFVETKKVIHIAGSITKEAIQKIEKQTGKRVVTHLNAKELDSPEIRKEIAQQALPEPPEQRKPTPLDQSLKGIMKVPPEKQ